MVFVNRQSGITGSIPFVYALNKGAGVFDVYLGGLSYSAKRLNFCKVYDTSVFNAVAMYHLQQFLCTNLGCGCEALGRQAGCLY